MAASEEIFESVLRSSGDLAGVFEHDGETGYFYLSRNAADGIEVVDAIHIMSRPADFSASDIEVRWAAGEDKVGLFVRGELWAVFDARSGAKYGGDYRLNARPEIPALAMDGFFLAS